LRATATPRAFGDLLPRSAVLDGSTGVDGDTAVASRGNRDRERNEFARLGVEMPGLLPRTGERLAALDGVGAELGDLADRRHQLLLIFVPIDHHD
jgi:hypothetical protein